MPFEKDSFAREKGVGQSLTHKKKEHVMLSQKRNRPDNVKKKQPKNSHYKTAPDK